MPSAIPPVDVDDEDLRAAITALTGSAAAVYLLARDALRPTIPPDYQVGSDATVTVETEMAGAGGHFHYVMQWTGDGKKWRVSVEALAPEE